jgi:hypothetical protein
LTRCQVLVCSLRGERDDGSSRRTGEDVGDSYEADEVVERMLVERKRALEGICRQRRWFSRELKEYTSRFNEKIRTVKKRE